MTKVRSWFTKKNLKYIIPSVLLIIILGLYLGRSYIRESTVPAITAKIYGGKLNKTLQRERESIDKIHLFGKPVYEYQQPVTCSVEPVTLGDNSKSMLWCHNYLFKGQVSIKDVSHDDFKSKAGTFEESLRAQGWTLESSSQEPADPTQPYDWWYRVWYEKKVDNGTCKLIVERDVDPGLLDSYLNCDRTFTYL